MKVIGYCTNGSKQLVAYVDRDCGDNAFKVTDGFHDKVLKNDSAKAEKLQWVKKSEINLERIARRIRGARPWHPILKILRKELTT